MKGRTHLAIGVGIGVVASVNHSPEMLPIILGTSAVASLAPDLDANNLLNRRITESAKFIKESGMIIAMALITLSLMSFFLKIDFFPFLDDQQDNLLLFVWGAVILGLSLRSQETLKNILMSMIGLLLLYYAITNEISWLVMFSLYIGIVGWFAHRGMSHTIWALIYWWYMSQLLENNMEVEGLATVSTIAYLSHIIGDMLTKKGVKFLYPITNMIFRIPK
ncbi:metal-dependent hydrolase [Oceanobacillus halophilus]|uniref:Metal-dependent hydrolase n=1 Tax=Oceanobacillus halophilus TaxID=930130 RepID=A0A494ZVC2_9BACI|nr:metal-dependent hydrolase [Oceanobacillus halophilus]RKQ30408.1 metal-dependent hydrolase [Oceanobacillus halophilus]